MVDSAFALMARPHLIELSRGSFDSYIVSAKHQARPSLRNMSYSGGVALDGSVLNKRESYFVQAKRYGKPFNHAAAFDAVSVAGKRSGSLLKI
jgi:hypothetical protein